MITIEKCSGGYLATNPNWEDKKIFTSLEALVNQLAWSFGEKGIGVTIRIIKEDQMKAYEGANKE